MVLIKMMITGIKMEEYWYALLKGLSPEKKEDLHNWWKIPLYLLLAYIALFLIINNLY